MVLKALRAWMRAGAPGPVSQGEHQLQVYAGDLPAADIARFLRTGLDNGEAGLVIATPANAFRIRQALGDAQARCVFLDASVELARFMVDGQPDPGRFHDALSPALRQAQRRGNGGVRAYGEMVAILCQRGQHQAAVHVEQLWNLLLRGQPVALLCAYPLQAFAGIGHHYLAAVQGEHLHASPASAQS
jgi:hypothetical protein